MIMEYRPAANPGHAGSKDATTPASGPRTLRLEITVLPDGQFAVTTDQGVQHLQSANLPAILSAGQVFEAPLQGGTGCAYPAWIPTVEAVGGPTPQAEHDWGGPPPPVIDDLILSMPADDRRETIKEIAKEEARSAAADAVAQAIVQTPEFSAAKLKEVGGIEPAEISRIKLGRYAEGPSLWKLAQIALLMGKRLRITFE